MQRASPSLRRLTRCGDQHIMRRTILASQCGQNGKTRHVSPRPKTYRMEQRPRPKERQAQGEQMVMGSDALP